MRGREKVLEMVLEMVLELVKVEMVKVEMVKVGRGKMEVEMGKEGRRMLEGILVA